MPSRRTPKSPDPITGAPAGAPDLPQQLTRWPGFMLSWVAEQALAGYTRALQPLGIRPQHLGILTLLGARGPLVQARIAEQLGLVQPVLVSLINELEALGLVQRRPHPSDGRAFEVHLLDAGQQRAQQAIHISQEATAAFFAPLAPEEQHVFQQMLHRLARRAPQDQP